MAVYTYLLNSPLASDLRLLNTRGGPRKTCLLRPAELTLRFADWRLAVEKVANNRTHVLDVLSAHIGVRGEIEALVSLRFANGKADLVSTGSREKIDWLKMQGVEVVAGFDVVKTHMITERVLGLATLEFNTKNPGGVLVT